VRAAAAVLLFCLLLLGIGLAGPPVEGPGYIHDECYQAFTAHRYALGDPDAWRWGERPVLEKMTKDDLTSATTYEWVHPPFAKLMMASAISAFGFTPTVYRLGSVLCGWLTIAMLLWLGWRSFGPRVGLFAAILVPLEGIFFVMSRVAMNDIYVTAALTGCVAATYKVWKAPGVRRRPWAVVAGLAAGIAIATKWNAAPTLVVCGLMVGWCLLRAEKWPAAIALWVLAFVVTPALVYLACYAPYFALGHGLSDLATLQKDIIDFHRGLKAGHSSSSRWYQWPALVRPVWLYQADGVEKDTLREIYAFGNPALWWVMFPAVLLTTYRAWREKSVEDAFVAVPFLAVWLPWAVIGRVTFIQYMLPAVPFGMLAIARTIDHTWRARAATVGGIYLALAGVCFAYYYPILTGMSVSSASVQSHHWFWFDAWRPCSGDCDDVGKKWLPMATTAVDTTTTSTTAP